MLDFAVRGQVSSLHTCNDDTLNLATPTVPTERVRSKIRTKLLFSTHTPSPSQPEKICTVRGLQISLDKARSSGL